MPILRLFADLLDYPSSELARQALACAEASAEIQPEAGALLSDFCRDAGDRPLARLQEIYTATFDLKPNCHPYVGYHLFGESYKRGAFMARLNQEYTVRGFSPGNDLPDHLSAILRFLALEGGSEFDRTLLDEGLVPALEKMAGSFDDKGGNPYGAVIRALRLVLGAESRRCSGAESRRCSGNGDPQRPRGGMDA